MHTLNHIEHSNLARRLIDQVGGLPAASRICGLSATVLSNYQNPGESATMPGRVISALQVAAGTTLYSDAMSEEAKPQGVVLADPLHHACGLMKEAAEALGAIEAAVASGDVSAREFSACDLELADIEERIHVIRAGLRGKLRVVS